MDGELEQGENEVKNDTERKTAEEGVPAEILTSDHQEGIKTSEELPVEAVTSKPGEMDGDELQGEDDITTRSHLEIKLSEVNEQPVSHEESAVFEINSSDDNEHHRLHVEGWQREPTAPAQGEEEDAGDADGEDVSYEECTNLLQELCEERDKAMQRSGELQMKLAEYLRKKAGDDALPEIQESEQVYEKSISILTELKQQLAAESETVQQQAEELRLQSQEKLDKVETEWQAFMALKQDVAVTVLSRSLGKQAAQAKVESALAVEQLRQDQLIKLRLKHIKLSAKIDRLETELQDEVERGRDTLQLQFEQLQAERLEQKKHIEKQSEELFKLQKKMSSSLEILSNVKEKMCWIQMEVQAKREQLAELEAMVARMRDLLTRTKQAGNSLQRDNQRLKERRGLLGNRVLLQDFEDTMLTSLLKAYNHDLKYILYNMGDVKIKILHII
uniref:CCDC113/CCDC96 coiled-coil domain-containing protein n=1 Tax=Anabas testudineus TaxID=64144 RepID=A0A3Q1J404_ANATE